MQRNKEERRVKRHGGIRKRIVGTPERPRLSVHRSLNNLYIQVIDDTSAKTICATSTQTLKADVKGSKSQKAESMGKTFAGKLKEKGIKKIAFDRGGYKYHGRIKALADSLRQAGIDF